MDPAALLAVLAAAVLHATWNALVKVGGDPFVRLSITLSVGTLCSVPLVLLAPFPPAAAWPFLATSTAIHTAYYTALCLGYQRGDLAQVYGIARGAAPPLVAAAAWLGAGETPTAAGAAAAALVLAGIWILALPAPGQRRSAGAIGAALATSVTIAGYTLTDGLGVRAAGNAASYVGWLFLVHSVPFVAAVAVLRRRTLRSAVVAAGVPAAIGGVLAFAGYAVVIWTMSTSPLALVAALRETSVVVAAWIGARVLREPLGARRIAAAALVASALVVLQATRAP